jgi:hypothetical protein
MCSVGCSFRTSRPDSHHRSVGSTSISENKTIWGDPHYFTHREAPDVCSSWSRDQPRWIRVEALRLWTRKKHVIVEIIQCVFVHFSHFVLQVVPIARSDRWPREDELRDDEDNHDLLLFRLKDCIYEATRMMLPFFLVTMSEWKEIDVKANKYFAQVGTLLKRKSASTHKCFSHLDGLKYAHEKRDVFPLNIGLLGLFSIALYENAKKIVRNNCDPSCKISKSCLSLLCGLRGTCTKRRLHDCSRMILLQRCVHTPSMILLA